MSLMDYERPSLTTDIVLMRIDERQSKNNRKNNEKCLQVLLVKRNAAPQANKWSLPGGFVDIDEEIVNKILNEYDMTPKGIITSLDLRKPIYKETACYGHFGREEFVWEKLKSNLNI